MAVLIYCRHIISSIITQYVRVCILFTTHSMNNGWVVSQSEPDARPPLLNVGGNSNSSSSNWPQYGLSAANSNNGLSNANVNIGARSDFVSRIIVIATSPLGERQENTKDGLVMLLCEDPSNKQRHMNRLKNTYKTICDLDTLEKASVKACRNRKDKSEVARFLADKDRLLDELRQDLLNHTYKPLPCRQYQRMENGKLRDIADAPLYPNRIVDWAIALTIEEPIDRRLVSRTYASIPGRGSHMVIKDMCESLRKDDRIAYVFVGDIHHFFKKIPVPLLKAVLEHYIKDRELLDLLFVILDSFDGEGIALGGLLSAMFANLYLNDLDHHMMEVRRCHYYWRYMDNFYIFGYSKPWLHSIGKELAGCLGDKGLTLNRSYAVRPVDGIHGFDCLGYVIYKDHVLLRKSTKQRLIGFFKKIDRKLDNQEVLDQHDRGGIASYMGVLRWCDSYNLRCRHVYPVLRKMRENDRWTLGLASYRNFTLINKEIYK